ncbi:hypothetical protein HDU79_011971, partial [Rhizoclosmatium sp. JEL0117]
MCDRRTPDSLFAFAPTTSAAATLTQYFTQVNGNVTITTNNYYGAGEDSLYLDVQFNVVEPVFESTEFNEVMYKSFSGLPGKIGSVVFYLAKNKFAVSKSSDTKDVWWVYSTTEFRWMKETNAVEVFCKTEVAGFYEQAKVWFREHTTDAKLAKNREARLDHILKQLHSPKDRGHVMHEAATEFKTAIPDFESLLDANPALLGFTNGVYDLERREFRAAQPTDYMSMSCGYPFETQVNDRVRGDILRFFEDIQPELQDREYLLKFLGSTLHGTKKDELFHIFTGGTRNGKSVLADLVKVTLGEYFTSIKSTLLTGEQGSSSGPSPDLMALYHKRFVVASEPEKGRSINSGFMKGITGNDDIVARPLYGNVTVFKLSHAIVLLCNGIPKMDEQDAAVWARSVVIPFPMTFVENPQSTLEKKIDKSLKTRIKEWGPQLMLMLTEWYIRYEAEGLEKTETLVASTNEYAEDSNPALMWFHECTEPAEAGTNIHLSTAFQLFQEWHLWTQGTTYRGSVKSFGKELRNGNVSTDDVRSGPNNSVVKKGVKNRK